MELRLRETAMADVVERLRETHRLFWGGEKHSLASEAAAEIERLRQKRHEAECNLVAADANVVRLRADLVRCVQELDLLAQYSHPDDYAREGTPGWLREIWERHDLGIPVAGLPLPASEGPAYLPGEACAHCGTVLRPPKPASASLATDVRATVEALANTAHGLSLYEWDKHANTLLAAADALEGRKPPASESPAPAPEGKEPCPCLRAADGSYLCERLWTRQCRADQPPAARCDHDLQNKGNTVYVRVLDHGGAVAECRVCGERRIGAASTTSARHRLVPAPFADGGWTCPDCRAWYGRSWSQEEAQAKHDAQLAEEART